MAVTVCSKGFQWVHGRAPRGEGSWGFFFGDTSAREQEAVFAPGSQSFGSARQWAVMEAKSRGFDHVRVAP